MQRRIPQKARSPLQPFLAVYGLTFSSILRNNSAISAQLTISRFSGLPGFLEGKFHLDLD
jgi:hypothetical protein